MHILDIAQSWIQAGYSVIQASINQLGIKSTKRGVLGFKVL